MDFIRASAVWIFLAIAAVTSSSAIAALKSVPPDVGNYSYGFIRCDTWHDGYASRAEDEEVGANYYYNHSGCGAEVTDPGPWATPTSPQGGTCGGYDITPSYYLGIESYNKTNDLVTYRTGAGCTSSSRDGMTIRRIRPVSCPPGYTPNSQTKLCDPPVLDPTKNNDTCPAGCNGTDPINSATGVLVLDESDFSDLSSVLNFKRMYTSGSGLFDASSLGPQWRDNFDRRISVVTSGMVSVATSYRANGNRYHFTLTDGQWTSDADVAITLVSTADSSGEITGWALRDTNGTTELYDANGYLTKIIYRDQRTLTLSYGGSYGSSTYGTLLGKVADERGRELIFKYAPIRFGSTSAMRMVEIDAPGGLVITYDYDGSTGLLTSVNYVGSVNGRAVTQTRSYVYGEGGAPSYAMTGLVDEAGRRYTSWSYDASHRATLSVHGTPTDFPGRTELTYNADGSTSIKNWIDGALGLSFTRLFAFDVVEGVAHLSNVSCNSCSSAAIKLPGIPEQPANVSYDASGYPVSSEDFKQNVTTTHYNRDGLLTQQIDALGTVGQRTTNTTWDSTLRVPLTRTVLDASGNSLSKTSWVYNSAGQVLARCAIDPSVATSYTCATTGSAPTGVRRRIYTYCDAVDGTQCPIVGLLLSMNGARTDLSQTTTYRYYLSANTTDCGTPGGACHQPGDLYQVTDALGHVTTYASYDGAGRVTRITDANGVNTDLTYTSRGWLATRTVGGAITTMGYTPYGAVSSVTDPDGVTTTYTYDDAHRLTDITDALGNRIHYTLDAAGNKTKEDIFDAGGTVHRSVSRSYNTLGQLTAIVDGLSHTVFRADQAGDYDANGNLVHDTDALGVQTQQSYDALNRLVGTIRDYNGTSTATQNSTETVTYDALDRTTGFSDPGDLATTYAFDGLSNPTLQQSPDTGTTRQTFDAAGNRIQQTDAKGVISTYTYDALDRLISVSYPTNTQNMTYKYDEANSITGCNPSYPIGHLTRIVETIVTTVFCYDVHGLVRSKRQIFANHTDTTNYAYSAGDRLIRMLYPSSTYLTYTRDGDGRIAAIAMQPYGQASVDVVTNVSYLPFGPLSAYTLGNGQTITRTYDANYALTDVTSPALTLHFTRNAMGDITALGNTPGASPAIETYQYDALYRLTAANDADGNAEEAYTYNKTGDRLSKAGGTYASGTYGYAAGTHHLTSVGNALRTVDANGNTTASTVGVQTYGFSYNDRNRLGTVQQGGSTVVIYSYNALGQRIGKTPTGGTLQRFDYDEASRLLGEYGSVSRDYVWLDDVPIAMADRRGTTVTLDYVHADGLGAPRAVTDSAGTMIWQWPYASNPFGEQQPVSANGYVLNLRFPGQYYDAESGLAQNVNRDYEANTGRYVQADPLGLEAGINLYSYVNSNPINATDPLGLCKGRWVQEGFIRVANFVCQCVWLCLSCETPVVWSGVPNDPSLPRTWGVLTASGGAALKRGNGCLCKNKPDEEIPCDHCQRKGAQ